MDFFSTLGVSQGASAEEVKAAFRRLALELHPDRHATSSPTQREAAAARFKVITEAYEVLSDERKRSAYEASSRAASAAYRYPSGRHSSFHNVNTDWTRRAAAGDAAGSSYTSTLGPWDMAWRAARRALRDFNIALHGGLAAILVVGVVAFDGIGDRLWQSKNEGKHFQDIQKARAAGGGTEAGSGGAASGGLSGRAPPRPAPVFTASAVLGASMTGGLAGGGRGAPSTAAAAEAEAGPGSTQAQAAPAASPEAIAAGGGYVDKASIVRQPSPPGQMAGHYRPPA